MMFLLNVGEYDVRRSSRRLPHLHLSSTFPTKDALRQHLLATLIWMLQGLEFNNRFLLGVTCTYAPESNNHSFVRTDFLSLLFFFYLRLRWINT
jgi:hypothetical protein